MICLVDFVDTPKVNSLCLYSNSRARRNVMQTNDGYYVIKKSQTLFQIKAGYGRESRRFKAATNIKQSINMERFTLVIEYAHINESTNI